MTFKEYMTNAIYSNYIDEHVASEDLSVLDYLYYDLKNDKENPKYINNITNVLNLLWKYNFKGCYIFNAFVKDFNEWENFYKEIDELFNLILKKNNILNEIGV